MNYPQSTYRLQFHAKFTFADATAIVPYLASLGVSHVYASSYLRAAPGSTHGYDVIDHSRLNPELGTQADFEALIDTLANHNMSHVLDTVPNHVGVATNENQWWNDVLEHGPASKCANYFDIAWEGSPRPELHGKLLLPLLGSPYGAVLEKGELTLAKEDGKTWVKYYSRRFPIDPKTAPASLDLNAEQLHELLEKQHYRLAYWKTASDEINYRRFFDINDLAALSMERPEVFEATHGFIFSLIEQGKISGLRIDHPDGLYDPKRYFEQLQERCNQRLKDEGGRQKEQKKASGGQTDSAFCPQPSAFPLYVVIEKILAPDEPLPTDWPVHGTSGYDFLIKAHSLFVNPAGEAPLTKLYQTVTSDETSYEDLVYRNKKRMLDTSLSSELHMLAHRLDRLAQRNPAWRDFTLRMLIEGLKEVIACYPLYRSYITGPTVSAADIAATNKAIDEAIRRNPKTERLIFDFLRDVLLQKYPRHFTEEDMAHQVRFAGKFQQVTAPVTAKGIEDTTFYQYNRFISLNEVGGEPSHFGVSPEQLHAYFAQRQQRWPYAMSTLSTHDTKRSEDVRARLNVLSEIPQEWAAAVEQWQKIGRPEEVSANEQYLLFQTLVGAWPMDGVDDSFISRVQAYMLKAMREAKVYTSWTDNNEAHEQAVTGYVQTLLRSKEFAKVAEPFIRRVAEFGLLNSIAQTVLKLTAPGVPDTYQGTELWDFSLVDPDNRRPVDYQRRQALLKQIDAPFDELLQKKADGRVKLRIHRDLLKLRQQHPKLFTEGAYEPIPAGERVFAFRRQAEGNTATVLIGRFFTQGPITGELPTVEGQDLLSGRRVKSDKLQDLLNNQPAAVIVAG